ncbi:LysR family transcriptional regulator [Conexibacter sp. SYSU D00693]|uniref:LysR family transcriptional regulator n=1 Tax=Conexibacter sp. SYSU D00693 TaxID=2812560 RepID=UPI00196BAEE8|nr:LysR family transcriptional regulator [Conexibacter sp. SYSU D00693]
MTLQQLEYFLQTLRSGSFTAAAETLLLAQPSLSEQVRRLEAELGVVLFQRVGRGIVPTDAARALEPHAESVLAGVEAAREAVVAQRELRGGHATFGVFGTSRLYPGTAVVTEFRRRHPRVKVRFVGRNSSEVATAVRGGELEAGIVALPIDDDGLDVRPVMRDEVVLVSADPAHLRHTATVEAMAQMPLVLADTSFRHEDPTRRQFSELAQRVGITLEPELEVEDVEVALGLAAEGLGATVATRGILLGLGDALDPRLGWVPFDDPVYDTFALISRRGARVSPAARELLALSEAQLTKTALTLRRSLPRRRRASAAGG